MTARGRRDLESSAWWKAATPAAEVVGGALAGKTLDALLVLGSGLSGVAERWPAVASWGSGDLPGAPAPTVTGHRGSYRLARVGKRVVFIQQGRTHFYEGLGIEPVLFTVRLARRLGARWLLLTNAAGSLDPQIPPGTLVVLEDQISFLLGRALGNRAAWGRPEGTARRTIRRATIPRGSPYDAGWVRSLRELADAKGIAATTGVLGGGLGPNYETSAEVRAMRLMGAHAGTMSTVLEASEGRSLGMRVGGISCISNLATGLSSSALDHDEVLELGKTLAASVGVLLDAALRRGPAPSAPGA